MQKLYYFISIYKTFLKWIASIIIKVIITIFCYKSKELMIMVFCEKSSKSIIIITSWIIIKIYI